LFDRNQRKFLCRIGLFAELFFAGLSKPYTGATAVLVDEFDAGGFQGAADRELVSGGK
jgi:hypothetical protein